MLPAWSPQPDCDVAGVGYTANIVGPVWCVQDVVPDLRIAKTVTPATSLPGEPITYTLTYSNTGLGRAKGVVLTDVVPSTITGVAYTNRLSLPVSPSLCSPILPFGILDGSNEDDSVDVWKCGGGGAPVLTWVA